MKAADTSVVVAAFASWHEHHEVARRAVDGGVRLIAHCALESYSVLTRLPAPHRSSSLVVREFLLARFPRGWLRLNARAYEGFVLALPDRGISGGSAYDALIAATAASFDADLATCDGRALPIYERYGVRALVLS